MLAIDYSKIPMDEKFMMLENLWADMTKKVNEVLDDREEKLKNGTSKFYDLEDIKQDIKKSFLELEKDINSDNQTTLQKLIRDIS